MHSSWAESTSAASAIVAVRHGKADEARQACAEIAYNVQNTEFIIGAADGWMTIALVERLLRNMVGCDAAFDRAIELYRAKGATALTAQAERWRNEPVPPTVT